MISASGDLYASSPHGLWIAALFSMMKLAWSIPIRMPDGSSSSNCILSNLSSTVVCRLLVVQPQSFGKFCFYVWTCIRNIIGFESEKRNKNTLKLGLLQSCL